MTLPQLAKLALETYIKEGKVILPPPGLSERFLQEKRGTFVTLEKKGQLRGCIGTYLPTKENIALEVISNAIAAGTKDWRFGPVKEEELPFLSYTVYILQKPERVFSLKELDPKRYGIIVKSGFKTGLLLPDLEGVDTIEKQIAIACQKAGIDPALEEIEIWKFKVEKFQ